MKNTNEEKRKKSVPLLAAVICIAVCLCCLSGFSWAWFNTSIKAGQETLSVADYSLQLTLTRQSLNGLSGAAAPGEGTDLLGASDVETIFSNVPCPKEAITFDAAYHYELTLTATGTADTGYGILAIDSNRYATGNMAPGESFTVSIEPQQASSIVLSAEWGTPSSSDFTFLESGKTYQIGTDGTLSLKEDTTVSENPEGQGTDPNQQDPNDQGTDPSQQDPNGQGTDPSQQAPNGQGTDPSQQDPNDQGTDPSQQDPNDQGTDPSQQDPNGQGTNPSQQDSNGQGIDPSQQNSDGQATA